MVTKNSLLCFKHELYHYKISLKSYFETMQYFRVATSKVTLDIFLWQTFNKYYDNILRLAKQPTGNHIQSRRHPNNRPPPAPTHQQSNQKTPATPPPQKRSQKKAYNNSKPEALMQPKLTTISFEQNM